MYLLLRDHNIHRGAIEVGWRLVQEGGAEQEGDLIWAYVHAESALLEWARHPAREWVRKIPDGIIDVRDIDVPNFRLFDTAPVLGKLPYYALGAGQVTARERLQRQVVESLNYVPPLDGLDREDSSGGQANSKA